MRGRPSIALLALLPPCAQAGVPELMHRLATHDGLREAWREMSHGMLAAVGLPVLASAVLVLLMLVRVRRWPALFAGLAGCAVVVTAAVAGFNAAQSSNALFQLVMLAALVLTPWACAIILGIAFAVALATGRRIP